MKKIRIEVLGILLLTCMLLGGCSDTNSEQSSSDAKTEASVSESEGREIESSSEKAELPDGVYTAEFNTDSSMFHVNEAYDGKGTLTVENGEITIHISLGSKNIVNLYPGLAEDAQKEGAELLSPTVDTVTYSDGLTEEVYGFDIPVPGLEKEFDLALIGTKGKWYDHKVIVSNPVPSQDESTQAFHAQKIEDGSYTIELTFEGGSGKAKVLSPATVVVSAGTATATIQWSSPNYDYMIVDGEKYLPVNTEGNSVFEIPLQIFDKPIDVLGDTVAMGTPHEIEYTLTFHSDTMKVEE
jgi:hypothetical protein